MAAPRGALVGTLIFTLLVPGSVIGVIPYVLSDGWTFHPPLAGEASRWLGAVLIALGAPLLFRFLSGFVREGHGTPAPIAPPKHLVVGGPFQWTRNPGYVAVLALVTGQGLLFGSGRLLVWAAVLAVGFHLFVILYEEPTLRATFGADYDDYCRRVPRWLQWPGRRA